MLLDLSIIMPVYNITEELDELTKTACKSILSSKLPGATETIMIDNDSYFEPKTPVDIKIKNMINLGYAPAVNQGIKLAHGKYLAIANNDIKVSPNWWEVAKDIFDNDSRVASVHFRMLPYESGISVGNQTWDINKERWCTSSFFVVRKTIMEVVGLYDEFYGVGSYDDYDLWHRVRALHYKQAYTNKACYMHKFSSTFKALGQDVRDKLDDRNYKYYMEKFGEYPDIQFANEFADQMSQPYHPFP